MGLITLRDVVAIPRERWDQTTVCEAMRPLEELHIITPDTQVVDALNLMAANDVNQLPVVADGALQGILSRSHLMQLLQTRTELRLDAAHYPSLHRMKHGGLPL